MVVGGWTRKLRPLPGELLTSCLARNAQAHGSTPYRFLSLFWPRDPVWERDFDRDPAELRRAVRSERAPDWLDELSDALGTARGDVEAATLAGWRSLLGSDTNGQVGDTPLLLSAGVFHRTRVRHALQFCPECLAEGVPYFRKIWRLGFVVACEVHGRALMDACGWCGASVMPHRSMTARLIDCGACGKPIGGRSCQDAETIPSGAVRLQRRLCAALDGQMVGTDGLLSNDELFATVRALLAVSAPPSVHAVLRRELKLDDAADDGPGRRRFEHCRHAVRVPWLETVAAWLDDWPCNFLVGADGIGASGRTFARCRVPPSLAAQVARLPVRRYRRRTPWTPLLEEPELRRLRRMDRAAYHATRAGRILNAIGRV